MVLPREWIEALRDLFQLDAMPFTMCHENWLDKAVRFATSRAESLKRAVLGAEILSNLYSVSILLHPGKDYPSNVQLAVRPYSVTR